LVFILGIWLSLGGKRSGQSRRRRYARNELIVREHAAATAALDRPGGETARL
jgi:hypothetical protein